MIAAAAITALVAALYGLTRFSLWVDGRITAHCQNIAASEFDR